MNSKSLYLEIGNIDDDLIEEASEARGHHVRKISFVREAAMAACLCLFSFMMFWNMSRDIIYYNEMSGPMNAKVVVPSDEDTELLSLTYQELFDHYGLKTFPGVLSGLKKTEQTSYFIYQSSGKTIFDTNNFYYCSEDGVPMVTITVAKAGSENTIQEDVQKSRMDGISVVFSVEEEIEPPIYWAEISDWGPSIRVVSYDMDKEEFTELIRELIQSQK